MGIPAIVNLVHLPRTFIVTGDAAATARNILASPQLYRVFVVAGVVSAIAFLFLALTLYELFNETSAALSRMLLVLVTASAAVSVSNVVYQIAPLIVLKRPDFLSPFSVAQLEALAYLALRLSAIGNFLVSAFWGLWLFPYGALVIRSGLFPKILGRFLYGGGAAYLAGSFVSLVIPPALPIVSMIAMPFMALGEGPISFWLLFKRPYS